MERLLDVVAMNALAAGALALVAWLTSRIVRRPGVVHALWGLVLLRLLAPPLLPVPLVPPRAPGSEAFQARLSDAAGLPPTAPAVTAVTAVTADGAAGGRPRGPGDGWRPGSWLDLPFALGAAVVASLALIRARRFGRLLRSACPAPEALAVRIGVLAGRIGLPRAPRGVVVEARIPPLLWPARGGVVVVLPRPLLADLTGEELDALLVHELAHLRRRDHWLRCVELLVTAFFWWYPVTWWARHQVRRAEELCCDEWVLRLLPAAGPHHAQGLLKAAAFTSGVSLPLPATASTALGSTDLRERLTAILARPPQPPLAPRARLALAPLAALLLAAFPAACRTDASGELSVDLAVLTGGPGQPLVKYIGLPVKVLPEGSFLSHLEAARARARARAEATAPQMRWAQERGRMQLTAARAAVDSARAEWLSRPVGPEKRDAERAYVDAMRRKDEAVRSDADLKAFEIGVAAAASGRGFVEIAFDTLPDPIVETRTGPDGRFTVRIPRSGGVVIAIALPTQNRWTPLGTQSYYWRASLDGRPSKQVLLRGTSGVQGEAPFVVAYRPSS